MQKVNIAELRRLHEAATKGQWVAMTAEYEAENGIAWAQSADCQRDADHAEYISACHNALPALLDELEAAQEEVRRQGSVIAECGEEVRRLTQANADLRKERDRAVAEAQRQDSVAKGLRKERDQLSAQVERRDKGLREIAEGAEEDISALTGVAGQMVCKLCGNVPHDEKCPHTIATAALSATPAQSLAAHDAALLRRLAAESAPGERADIAPWLLAEADRIEKEAANGKTGS